MTKSDLILIIIGIVILGISIWKIWTTPPEHIIYLKEPLVPIVDITFIDSVWDTTYIYDIKR